MGSSSDTHLTSVWTSKTNTLRLNYVSNVDDFYFSRSIWNNKKKVTKMGIIFQKKNEGRIVDSKYIFSHFWSIVFKGIYHFFFPFFLSLETYERIRILFELETRSFPSLMTNALSCYARDKLPPCSLFLLILKIVPTFFPLPPPDESLDRVTRTKINKSCSLLEVSFVFSKKGKKKSFALVRETRFDYHELSCYTTRRRRQFRCNHMKQIE